MTNAPETQNNEHLAIISGCESDLRNNGIAEERIDALKSMLETALEANVIETIEDSIELQRTKYRENVGPEEIGRMARGYLFETIAINNLPTEKSNSPEFEKFLLESLKDPSLWLAEFDFEMGSKSLANFTEQEAKLIEKYKNVRPTLEELKALRNNDAIVIHINENTGTAEITGVVEAKNHALHSGTRDEAQAKTSLHALSTTVNRYKEVFPILVKYLGLQEMMPSKIDIVPETELTYTIVQPEDLKKINEQNPPTGAFEKADFIYVPVTKNEIAIMAKTLSSHIK